MTADAEPTEEDTIQFDLKVKCTRNPKHDATDPDDLYRDHKGIAVVIQMYIGCIN